MALSQTSVLKLYHTVIDDVIAGVRDAFLDEGVDEQVLQEMKQVWTNKLLASKAIEVSIDPLEPQPPPILSLNSKSNGTKSKNRPQQQQQQQQQQPQQQTQPQQQQQQQQQSSQNTTENNGNASNQTFPNQTNGTHKPLSQPNTTQQSTAQPQTQTPPAPPAIVAGLDPSKIVPIQITLPPQPNVPNSEPRVLTIQVPASAIQANQLQQVLTGPIISSIMQLPPTLASSVLQQHVTAMLQNIVMVSNAVTVQKQLDGAADTSDEDASDVSDDNLDGDDDDDLDKEDDDEAEGEGGPEDEPLNSDDDVSEEEQADLFDTDNVVVCQYDKITRSRNKWKFYLKDGIMNIGGKDYVFQKSNGDAEW
ncbi:hypothetical protein HA402_006872 [Bradysia odoriphaga]|nr:hypothetical protein HA402_006872 [Bradysia odoriphaga]